jgi:hypothetical protein
MLHGVNNTAHIHLVQRINLGLYRGIDLQEVRKAITNLSTVGIPGQDSNEQKSEALLLEPNLCYSMGEGIIVLWHIDPIAKQQLSKQALLGNSLVDTLSPQQ